MEWQRNSIAWAGRPTCCWVKSGLPCTYYLPYKFSFSPQAAELGAIGVRVGALAVALAVLELAGVRFAIGPRQCALAVELVVLKLAGVRGAIGERQGALAVVVAVYPLAGVLGAIGECQGALAVE